MQKLFETALGIVSPWYVKSVDFNVADKRLDIEVDFERGLYHPKVSRQFFEPFLFAKP